MHQRFHHIIFALATVAVLLGGCTDRCILDTDGDEIIFGAPGILEVQNTKAGLETETKFHAEDIIEVSAWHLNGTGTGEMVLENQKVVCPDPDAVIWDYTLTPGTTTKRRWNWQDSDYYDFLAVAYKRDAELKRTIRQSNIRFRKEDDKSLYISVPYDAEDPQYDLLMAGLRRTVPGTANPSSVVELEFKHVLSAVKVVFYKAEGNPFIPKSYYFTNLVTQADIQYGYIDGEGFLLRETSLQRRSGELFKLEYTTQHLVTEDIRSPYDHDQTFYLLLPSQDLKPEGIVPQLVVEFEDNGGNQYEFPVDLKQVREIDNNGYDTGRYITRWEPGQVYVYKIGISLNAGVLVKVATTPWTVINAQTPGLMI